MHWSVPRAVGGYHAQLNLHQVTCTEKDGTFTFHREATPGLLTIFKTGLVGKGTMNHCCHNCLGAFSVESKLSSLNFLWSMDHSFSKQTRNDSSSDSKLEGLIARYDTAFFYPCTCSGRAKTETIKTQEKMSVETRGWDGGPRAGVMPDTSEEVLGKLSSVL